MDLKKIIGILIIIVVLMGVVGGVILVQRQQSLTGKAVVEPTPSPSVFFPSPAVFFPSPSVPFPPSGIVGDFNQDGKVDSLDLAIFKQKYAVKDPATDLDNSGEVNSLDYNLFLSKME